MNAFWCKGYEATSIQDLVEAMGINRFSLYDTFGDKHQLFCAACRRYLNSVGSNRLALIRDSENGIDGIRKFFDTAVRFLGTSDGRNGCLMTNTAAEFPNVDEKAVEVVELFFNSLHKEFKDALSKAKKRGKVSSTLNINRSAQYLVANAQGIWIAGKVNYDKKALDGIVEMTMSVLT
jgi:TetR/AcrR family transcriptional repressor of nem operon